MKSHLKYLYIIVMVSFTMSCKKYLDVIPDNVGTIDYAFRNRNEAEKYLFTCYSTLQKFNNTWFNPAFTTSGEIIFPNNLINNMGINPLGFNLIRGTQNAGNPALNYWDGAEGGQSLFVAIRHCNTMLENIDKPIDLTQGEKARWIAEVKFLKAYYHFYLMRMYGPIPITDTNLPINSSIETVKVKRAPVDSVVNYVVKLLDEARPSLPPAISNQTLELGRITQLIALSVKAEVLSTAASPLFNGNPDFAGFKDKEGVSLFSSQIDRTKWDRAAIACKEAVEFAEDIGLKLHNFVPPANVPATLTDSLKKVLTLQTAITEKWELNTELIWALNPVFGFGQQEYGMPRLTVKSSTNLIAQGTLAVPIAQQELFYTNKGLPINEDKNWDYAKRYELKTAGDQDRFYVHKGYETVNAHFNREPRFYSSVAFDGGVWYGNGVLTPENALYVQARGVESYAGPKDLIYLNVSGYWPKKLVNYLTVYDERMTWEPYHFPLMRLAGLYLLYAEVLNEQGKNYTEVIPYIDKVRVRAGLPGVTDSWSVANSTRPGKYDNQQGLREIIHQERRIELAFEGQAGWDLRRWKEMANVMSRPLQGWNIYEGQALNYYRPRNLVTPVFNVRNYLWPIRSINLTINDNLVQNPLW